MASNTGWNSSTNTGAIGNDQSLNNSSDFNAFPEGNRTSMARSTMRVAMQSFGVPLRAIQITHGTAPVHTIAVT